jgi:hypothetical protein
MGFGFVGNNILDSVVRPGVRSGKPPSSCGWIIDRVINDVDRVNVHYYYELAQKLTRIEFDEDAGLHGGMTSPLVAAQSALEKVASAPTLGLCREAAINLSAVIDECIRTVEGVPINEVQDWFAKLREALVRFEVALSVQLDNTDVYIVTSKGTHNTRKLIGEASASFSQGHWFRLSEIARRDWEEGARCLAFGRATASGFHAIRAVEAVVVYYLKKLKVTPKKRDLGHYIELLNGAGVDKRGIEAVDQIRSLHRNPLMHPEDTLEIEEALDLFDLCKSAIKAILRDMVAKGL